MSEVTPDNYRVDPLFPRIEKAVIQILAKKKYVAPVDLFVAMEILRPERLEDWRRGRVDFLERVLVSNLSKLRRILAILGFYCHDLQLEASQSAYTRTGGPRTPLRFTKTREPRLEKVYARHFVWRGNSPFPLERATALRRRDDPKTPTLDPRAGSDPASVRDRSAGNRLGDSGPWPAPNA